MFKNYFKTAIRNLSRNRAFAVINILGLVLGISGAVVIYRIITFEQSFDTYHDRANDIYRINLVQDAEGDIQRAVSVMHPLGPAVRTDFPDWAISRIHWWGQGVVTIENDQGEQTKFLENSGMAFVETDFFEIFDFEFVAGNPDKLLEEPNTMAMSTKAADKLFDLGGKGYQSIIGKTIRFENKLTIQIRAVYKELPKNTDLNLDYLMFYEGAKIYPYAANLQSWGTRNGAARLWVKLPKGQAEAQAEALLREASKDYLANIRVTDPNIYFALEPLREIHLDENTGPGGLVSSSVISILRTIGIILVLVAAINFINLATAQSVKRAKEIGIRKVLGSQKSHLIIQFLGEVFLLTTLSVIISLGLSEGALIQLEPVLGYELGLNLFTDPSIVFFLLGLIGLVTIMAGFYPAMVLANYNPIAAIKNSALTAKSKSGSMSVRRVLVVVQFFISQGLIIGTLVMISQMNFMENKALGFRSEGLLTFSVPERTQENMDLLKNRISALPSAGEIGFHLTTPGAANTNNLDKIKDPRGAGDELFGANRKNVDHNYANVFDLEILAGAFYRPESPDDHSVVNRKFAESLGFTNPEEAVGQRYETEYGRKYLIVGVVEDFHNNSLRASIDPVFMMSGPNQYFEGAVQLKVNDNFSEIVADVEEIWSEVFTEDVFTYQFLEDRVEAQYEIERKVSGLVQIFAAVAIFIGCLGLYGLVSFMANQKVKEIGIRKVLGATVSNILMIFSREVIILVIIAFVLAAPLMYYGANWWLDSYEYRIPVGATIFILGILATAIISAATVGLKAMRAATANPINSLRDE